MSDAVGRQPGTSYVPIVEKVLRVLGPRTYGDFPYEAMFKRDLADADAMCRAAGEFLRSRQVIAAILVRHRDEISHDPSCGDTADK